MKLGFEGTWQIPPRSPSTCLVGEIASECLLSVLWLGSLLPELLSIHQQTFIQCTFIEHLQCARHRIWKRDAKLNKTWSMSSLERPLTPMGDIAYKRVIII